jgi:hypothetical protein
LVCLTISNIASQQYHLQPVCMFDKFHLTFNFISKVSRDVFKNKNECQSTSTFSSKISLQCHMPSSSMCHFKFLKCQLTCGFILDKSHYMSKSKLCVSIDVHFIFVQVFACQNAKTCNFFLVKHTLSPTSTLASQLSWHFSKPTVFIVSRGVHCILCLRTTCVHDPS